MNANWVKESVSTTGTGGALTLTGAAAGFIQFSSTYIVGNVIPYTIVEGNNKETGIGVLTNATTFTKTTIWEKLEGGVYSKLPALGISLTGSAALSVSISAQDVIPSVTSEVNIGSLNYLVGDYASGTIATLSTVLNRITFSPLIVSGPCILSGLTLNVTGLISAAAIQLGLYILDNKTLRKLDASASIDVSTETGTVGYKVGAFSNGNMGLKPGSYYAAMHCNAAGVVVASRAASSIPFQPGNATGRATNLITTGTAPLAATYGPIDGNWNAGASNPHVLGMLV